MTYSLLGQDLQETADLAKRYFAEEYGATHFKCEEPIGIAPDLALRPTWQADVKDGYKLCLDVQPTPITPTLYEFVLTCAKRGLPLKLWVAVPGGGTKDSFKSDLKQAKLMGIGVVEFADGQPEHVFSRPVAFSLFALSPSQPKGIPKQYRPAIKTAEGNFLDGSPEFGCQGIFQELEDLSRKCAQDTFNRGWWSGNTAHQSRFFEKDPWANVLEEFEKRIDVSRVKSKCPQFDRRLITKVRAQTDWRNDVSHKPKNAKQLQERDSKLRSHFEVARELLIDWATKMKGLRIR